MQVECSIGGFSVTANEIRISVTVPLLKLQREFVRHKNFKSWRWVYTDNHYSRDADPATVALLDDLVVSHPILGATAVHYGYGSDA